jgi:ribosome maturation factor RimP
VKICELKAQKLCEELGFTIVSVETPSFNKRPGLRFTLDKLPLDAVGVGSAITLNDCALFSRKLSVLIDEIYQGEGPSYVLVVSSPGLDRYLRTEAEMKRFVGSLIKVKFKKIDRNVTLTGKLGWENGVFSLRKVEPALGTRSTKGNKRLKKKAPKASPSPQALSIPEALLGAQFFFLTRTLSGTQILPGNQAFPASLGLQDFQGPQGALPGPDSAPESGIAKFVWADVILARLVPEI